MLSAPRLLANATAVGLVSRSQVLAGRVSVIEQSRSNVVHRLATAGRPVAYVKQRGNASLLDDDDAVANEAFALRALMGLRCVPELLSASDSAALWTRAVPGVPLHEMVDSEYLRVCHEWGATLATLHAWPTGQVGALHVTLPWAASPHDLPPSMQGSSPDSVHARVLAAARDEPALLEAGAQVRRRWRAQRWIHGDLGSANVLVPTNRKERHSGPRECRIRFVDFEGAGLGPPEWDVATALDTVSGLASHWQVDDCLLQEALLDGYRSADGTGQVDAAFQSVRALTTAWQIAGTHAPQGARDEVVRQVEVSLDRARRFATLASQTRDRELVA